MAASTTVRKPLGIRATQREHSVITRAASREGRSVNSFVLRAALEAAESTKRRKTPEEVLAAVRRAQDLMKPYRQPGRSLVDELSAERRAEAARE